ncbi:stage II sporulation protein R [Halolactibacillus alkaliphilus]|nr:stage II sporulation protein R [Halolactibacillus alkaliphilus]
MTMKKQSLAIMHDKNKNRKRQRALNIGMVLLVVLLMLGQLGIPNKDNVLSYDVKIPEQAIRLRILAHSDADLDQQIKHVVRDEISLYVSGLVEGIETIDQARDTVRAHVSSIENKINSLLEEKSYPHQATVIYGENIYFPTKVYETHVYPQGEYEAVLITLGEGRGGNWWCVLFPALCYIDFNGDMTVVPEEKVEELENEEENARELEETAHNDQPKLEPRFWLVEQISTLIHKFSG